MWSETSKTGQKRYVERYKDPYTGKLKRVSVKVEKFTAQAKNRAAKELLIKINEKLSIKNEVEKILFGQLFDEFEESWKQGVRKSTITAASNIKAEIKKRIPDDYIVKNIDRRLLQKIINDLIKEGRSHNYVGKVKAKLNQVMKYAIRMGYISINEMDYVEMPRKVITREVLDKKRSKYLDQVEFKLFIQNLKEEAICDYRVNKYIRIAEVLYLTGMRYGELSGLSFDNDLDFKNKTIHIRHTFNFPEKIRTAPKTAKSDRIITAPNRVFQIFKTQMAENLKNGFETDYIFINTKGYPTTPERVIGALKRHGQKAGIDKNITTHIFRHSHISLLAELGVPLPAIMDRVGHTDSKTTLEIYSHVTDKMNNDITDKLNKLKY
ncbi:site-specific integrase [Streptococcus agalactiae]